MQREETRFIANKERDSKVKIAFEFYSGEDRKIGKEYHSRLKCDYCGKIGHVKEKCFEADERKEYPEATTLEHVMHGVHAKSHANADENMSGKLEYCFNWILDSGVSHHMSPLTTKPRRGRSDHVTRMKGFMCSQSNISKASWMQLRMTWKPYWTSEWNIPQIKSFSIFHI
ncbi:hypothetical protein KIW84_011749 [Lathyrus oleraceus]|uniref:CCHC-type domain-containing protein n=1 Tax=Pisum sativum TaxID=3888 RepID=A0A9D5BFU2_PEA|nr:hypothetical protein KIW84_011749 [Pisum sativum]